MGIEDLYHLFKIHLDELNKLAGMFDCYFDAKKNNISIEKQQNSNVIKFIDKYPSLRGK